MVYLFVGFLAIGPHRPPQTLQAIANAVDYQLELDLKTLLLKINQPWNIKPGEMKLVLIWRHCIYWLDFLILEDATVLEGL